MTQAVATAPTDPESIAALEEQRAAEDREYQRLKAELQAWCFGTAISCFAATLVFYSRVSFYFRDVSLLSDSYWAVSSMVSESKNGSYGCSHLYLKP